MGGIPRIRIFFFYKFFHKFKLCIVLNWFIVTITFKLSKVLRRSLMIFIIKGIQTIVFTFIVISSTFRSVKVPEFDKHLKKAGGHIGRNVVEITIKMKTIVQKPLMIKNYF